MRIVGKNGLIFADLHISDVYTGMHINYLANCFWTLGRILKFCKESKPDYVIFLGDIVGWKEKLLRNRAVLLQVCTFFKELNALTNNNVYVVRGNHDMGEFTEFDFFSGLGYVKTANYCLKNTDDLDETLGDVNGYIDCYPSEDAIAPEVRFHLVDYGTERKPLAILSNGESSNIVLGHNNYTIHDVTNWYQEHDGIELSTLTSWKGVDLVLSGHIHNPSPYMVSTFIDGYECALFYLGCPTRPSKDQAKYPNVFYAEFSYNNEEKFTDWKPVPFDLEPAEKVFQPEDKMEVVKTEEDVLEEGRKENLKVLLQDIMHSRMTSGDLLAQVECIPNASRSAKDIAKQYLQLALDNKAD